MSSNYFDENILQPCIFYMQRIEIWLNKKEIFLALISMLTKLVQADKFSIVSMIDDVLSAVTEAYYIHGLLESSDCERAMSYFYSTLCCKSGFQSSWILACITDVTDAATRSLSNFYEFKSVSNDIELESLVKELNNFILCCRENNSQRPTCEGVNLIVSILHIIKYTKVPKSKVDAIEDVIIQFRHLLGFAKNEVKWHKFLETMYFLVQQKSRVK